MSTALMPIPTAVACDYAEPGDPFLFRRARTWWLLLALFLLAQGDGMFTTNDGHESLKGLKQIMAPPPGLLLMTVALWVICAALMFTRIGSTLRVLFRHKSVLAFAVLAFLSTLWSQVPWLTFRKATVLLLIMAFAWFFTNYYSPADQMRLTLALGVIVALTSIAWVIFLPRYGITGTGEWKGVFGQKNLLGNTIFFLFSALPFCRIASVRRLLIVGLQAVVPIGLILLSRSRTPLFMTAALIAVRVFGPLLTRMRKEAIPFLLYTMGAGMLIILATLGVILPLLGRDLTLTGRTHEWALIVPFALKHLWLGYGFQGFWIGPFGDSGTVISLLGAGLNTADNGYLDLMLQFGLVGIGLLLILLIVCIRDFLSLLRRPSVALIAYWYAGLIVAIFVGSITEGMFWMPIRIIPFMFALACAGLRRISVQPAPSVMTYS
jgi:exopolysaccharide production protein ExoQ